MTSALAGLISLIMPLGIGLGALFAAILAHRGLPGSPTWILIISAATYLLSLIGLGVSQFFFFSSFTGSGSFDNHQLFETLMMIAITVFILSLLSYSIGIFLMGRRWKSISDETAGLERLAQELATAREQGPA